ncbi:aconitate hydratase [Blattabacterium sp. (Cryptocercus kyebangensis)]|uniref:aconitate hydratase n=1 Tax=Blattabacterium sp. (Cryptocercus kyebangensis) TaxID=298656 RepID=UPI000D7CA454|nr:aconitate hydratase [Blattabacterium sp. (Cryptocercus kyebangensis)]AWU43495.1 aconitate hydratase [Blattabacterium sp. (Cryptocercus kyebangensis)]
MILDINMIRSFYSNLKFRISKIRNKIGRPMNYSEKILYSHVSNEIDLDNQYSKESYLNFFPDRLAMQDATAQMTILQFMKTGENKTKIPTTVHCDHLIKSINGEEEDLKESIRENQEIYDFLKSASYKYGIGFWNPGSGIIHQIVLENYAFPGGMMIGTDSHTPNAGGLGMLAIGIGGADAVEVMSGSFLELKIPKIIGVYLKGNLNGWSSPKDVILKLSGILGVSGAKGFIIEYFGDGIKNISCTGKATICNMGAEVGATSSLFPYDSKMRNFLDKSGRKEISEMADKFSQFLKADREVYKNPYKYYDKIIEIDLNVLEPHINGPFTPDRSIPISKMKEEVVKNNWPIKIEVGLIGSCTNSSYEDLSKSISIVKQAKKKRLKISSEFLITPGSEKVYRLIKKQGFISIFHSIGAKVFSNSCGPCIGQWSRKGNNKKRENTIIHSFNRNFSSRNDGNPKTHAFIASPEIVTALIFSGYLTFDPRTDKLKNEIGEYIKFEEPKSIDMPIFKNYNLKELGYENPEKNGKNISVNINPKSKRIQPLSEFSSWNREDLLNIRLLIKVKGKCTTDHISMAGPWLKYRGHLEKISENLLIGAVNAFNNKVNEIKNIVTGNYGTVPDTAKFYKFKNIPTLIVGDENYGEGSSREHAAMEPRFLGVRIVLVKSFSRIHETNLKKQGILALTFFHPSDYYKIQEEDIFHFYIKDFSPKKSIDVELIHNNGNTEMIKVQHSYNKRQIQWFIFGSFLNFIREKNKNNFI